jgi:ketosteroid isomerase-like protein
MLSRMVGWYLRREVRTMLSGDVGHVVRQFSDDAELVFPGHSSFAGRFRGKAQIGAWLRRFVGLEPVYDIRDVLVAGPPWNMRVAYRLDDRIGQHYRNEAMVYLRFRWMKLVGQQVFLDTERVAAWERDHPEETGRELIGEAVPGREHTTTAR